MLPLDVAECCSAGTKAGCIAEPTGVYSVTLAQFIIIHNNPNPTNNNNKSIQFVVVVSDVVSTKKVEAEAEPWGEKETKGWVGCCVVSAIPAGVC